MVGEKTGRILIVDDTREIHDDFKKILASQRDDEATRSAEAAFFGESVVNEESNLSYDLDHADQGEVALPLVLSAIAEGRPYDVAFVDMRMPPGWDGIETIKHLWEADPQLQVVVCTAYSDYSWADMVNQLGVNDKLLLLKKPFDNAEVQQLAVMLREKRKLADFAAQHVESLEATIAQSTAHLLSTNEELDSLLNAISSLLIGLDAKGNVTRWNAAAAAILGISQTDTRGKPFIDLPIEWEQPAEIREILNTKSKVSARAETSIKRQSGETRILGLSAYPIGSPDDPRGLLLLGADLTEHKIVEHQMAQSQKLEAVGQLAAGVAHEINTPMQYLGDNTEFLHNKVSKLAPLLESYGTILDLAEQSGDKVELVASAKENLKKLKIKSFVPQVLEAISDSRDGVKHVSRIVKAMKEFSHPGQEDKTSLDINNSLESATAVSTNEWKYVADLELDLDTSIPLVCGFPGELNQVFLNIIVNAAHAISDANDGGASGKGTITISTRSDDESVTVSIGDSGTGIPEDIRQRIFDPFFTTKEVGKGTGQGLSIAHSVVVQKHGGAITCESTLGQGTTFTITLPIDGGDNSPEVSPELATCDA